MNKTLSLLTVILTVILIGLVVWGGILNREHQRRYDASRIEKQLDDTIHPGVQYLMFRGRLYSWYGYKGQLDTVMQFLTERRDTQ